MSPLLREPQTYPLSGPGFTAVGHPRATFLLVTIDTLSAITCSSSLQTVGSRRAGSGVSGLTTAASAATQGLAHGVCPILGGWKGGWVNG